MPPHKFVHEYPACKHIKRNKIHIDTSEDITHAEDTDVLPLFEVKRLQYKIIKQSSLISNEFLKCRWGEYLKRIEGRVKTPFQFPSVYDVHFCNYLARYDPNQTIGNRATFRLQMPPGPGVDDYGQVPIPDNMHLRKTEVDKILKNKKS